MPIQIPNLYPRYQADPNAGVGEKIVGQGLDALGTLFTAINEKANKEAFTNATIEYQRQEIDKLIELENDPDYDGRLAKYRAWSATTGASIVQSMNRPEAQKQFEAWRNEYSIGKETTIGLQAQRDFVSNVIRNVPDKLDFWASTGDDTAAMLYLENDLAGIVSEDDIQSFKQEYAKRKEKIVAEQTKQLHQQQFQSVQEGLNDIVTDGRLTEEEQLSYGIQLIDNAYEASPLINEDDKLKLVSDLKGLIKIYEDEKKDNVVKRLTEFHVDVANRILKGERIEWAEFENNNDFTSESREPWRDIILHQYDKVSESSTTEIVQELEDEILSIHLGESQFSKLDTYRKILGKWKVRHEINDKVGRNLLERLKFDMPYDAALRLRSVVDTSRAVTKRVLDLPNKERLHANQITEDLYNYTMTELVNGRTPTSKDLENEMRSFLKTNNNWKVDVSKIEDVFPDIDEMSKYKIDELQNIRSQLETPDGKVLGRRAKVASNLYAGLNVGVTGIVNTDTNTTEGPIILNDAGESYMLYLAWKENWDFEQLLVEANKRGWKFKGY